MIERFDEKDIDDIKAIEGVIAAEGSTTDWGPEYTFGEAANIF